MPKFTKQHYEIIANILHSELQFCYDTREVHVINQLRLKFQKHFALDNPNFDRERFKKAIGFISEDSSIVDRT